MDTKIIATFPGAGKSHLVANNNHRATIVDLDSNAYTSGYDDAGVARNVYFPANYIQAINDQLGKADILLIGCQPEVLRALREEGIRPILVYPKRHLRNEYIARFQKRHSAEVFVNLIAKNWDMFLDFLEKQDDCEHTILSDGQYLGDVISTL